MTTDIEAENVAASVLHLLTQRGKDARNWQAQAEQHEVTIQGLRAELDETKKIDQAMLEDYAKQCARLASQYAQIDRYYIRARMMLQQIERQRQEAADWKQLAERRRDELSVILEDARVLSERYTALRAALQTIHANYGHVCAAFDRCQHAGCRDSVAAWHVANAALGEASVMLDTIFQMLQEKRRPCILHISYRWERALRQEMHAYDGILPIVTPVTVFGMCIQTEYTSGPWAWIEDGTV